MKTLIALLIAMMVCSAHAQQPAPCLKLSKIKIDRHMLHQQDETMAQLTFKAHGCYVLHGNELPVMTFETKPELDVTLSNTRFGRLDPSSAGTGTEKAQEMLVWLRFIASPDLAVGEHTLRGLLTYKVADKSGNVSSETLAIAIPFKVAPPVVHKQRSAFMKGLAQTGQIIRDIPMVLLMLVVCPFANCY